MKVKRTWEAGWYEEQDKPGILAINQIQYGDVALSHEAYFDWLQTQNPMGSPILPLAREKETGKRAKWWGLACLFPCGSVGPAKSVRL